MALKRIGISANLMHPDKTRPAYWPKTLLYGEESLYRWVAKGGAIPYMVPRLADTTVPLKAVVDDLDGVIFSGGVDISPRSYGEQAIKPEWQGDYDRDQYEIELFNLVRDAGKPVLGVCRGHQLINVALGGTMFQDIQTQNEGAQCHRDGDIYDGLHHDVSLIPGSVLSGIYGGRTEGRINTIHHQAIKDLGQGLTVQARSIPDGIIESVWYEGGDGYIMGVQWHPEWIQDSALLPSTPILSHFLNAVS